ncbi:sensor domain-containing diguanylate cyclase [Sagittula stellata]|uniref:diguanylate cyclase n=1 Tax=Sagittula stellata (strain ATCC 700073 / DSM 11524 / E-37) TaxID=388399 RepID=A3K3F2_SAGS3|nr:diguanylate cyclase [Sagittula stellata]EBA08066.1 Intracellular signaling protein (PAS,GAF,GGDEF domains) [Sagittula stellata E-37]
MKPMNMPVPMERPPGTDLVQAVFQVCHDAVVFTDSAGRVQWCNRPFERLTGYRRAELIGGTLDRIYAEQEDFGVTHPLSGPRMISADHRIITNYLRRDGSLIEAETSGWSFLSTEGAILGHIRIFEDYTATNRLVRVKDKLFDAATDQATSPGEKVDAMISLACEFLHMPVGLVGLVRDSNLLVHKAKSTLAPIPIGTLFPLEESDCRIALAGDVPFETHSTEMAQKHPLLPDIGLRTYIGVPLVVGGERIGTLSFLNPLSRAGFTSAERQLISDFARFAAQQLAQERQIAALERAATQDWLTGAGSSRQFRHDIENVFRTVRRNDAQASLILIDVDHFKSINDAYGHDMGDRVLTNVARSLETVIGANRRLYRVGGEEFAVILPGSCADSAAIMAEQMRQRLAEAPDLASDMPSVTASFGVAELDPDITSQDAWVKCADIALYASKNNGRNQVTSNGSIAGVALPDELWREVQKKHAKTRKQSITI